MVALLPSSATFRMTAPSYSSSSQGGVLELLGKQRLEGNSLTLLHVHAEVIDGNLVLAQLADADLDGWPSPVEDIGSM